MTLADAHLHLFRPGYTGHYGEDVLLADEPRAYEAFRAAHGIERGLVVGYEGEPCYAGNNELLATLAAERPWMAPVAFLPAKPEPTPQWLECLWMRGFVGISLYATESTATEAILAWGGAVLACLRERAAVVSINATPETLRLLGPFIRSLEGCSILLSHLGLPGARSAAPSTDQAKACLAPVVRLAEYPYVGVKLSGFHALSLPSHLYPHAAAAPFLELVMDAFGPRRLFWGSDFPACLAQVSFPQAVDVLRCVDWPDDAAAAVMAGNLLRLLSSGGMD